MSRDLVIQRFLDHAVKAAAGTRRVVDQEGLLRALAEIIPRDAAVYCPAYSALEKGVVPSLKHRVNDYASADVTIEEALAGIAETGSIVCTSLEGRAVQASLLPSHHVALLPAGKIFETLDDFFAAFVEAPPTNIAVITGPSRTADIELTLAIGVHGPERLDVIIV